MMPLVGVPETIHHGLAPYRDMREAVFEAGWEAEALMPHHR
jgi:hypothetical protein